MLDGRQAQRRRIEARGEVGLLANRAIHLQLDQAVISTAYSIGSSLMIGSINPFTISYRDEHTRPAARERFAAFRGSLAAAGDTLTTGRQDDRQGRRSREGRAGRRRAIEAD
jgi:hypothetical protein